MLAYVKDIGDILPFAAKRHGDKTALVFKGEAFSFKELDALSNRLANSLDTLGVLPGDRVSIYSGNCWQWIVSYYAAAKTGAIVNPVNVMLTPEEVRFVAEDCGSKVIILSKDKAEPTRNAVRDVAGLSHIICYEAGMGGILSFQDLLDNGSPAPKTAGRQPDDISTICYTSGTTGHPKGAALSHRAVLLNTFMTANVHAKTQTDCTVTALPSAHVYGNVVMNGMIALGGKLVLLDRFDEIETMTAIETNQATLFEGVPTMYLFLLNHPDLEKYDFSSLTRCTVGGQTMSVVGKVPDELKGELAHAFIVLKNKEAGTKEEFQGFCREHLAAYKVPRDIHFVDALPQTSTGKIMRRELANLL